jgi:hypothetical protein
MLKPTASSGQQLPRHRREFTEVYGELNGRFVLSRPCHPMGPASNNKNMVARTKALLTLALDAETCRAGEKQYPFIMSLKRCPRKSERGRPLSG